MMKATQINKYYIMKNQISNYKSVPVTASVIKTVNSKAVYLYNIESLDGNIVYKPRFIPQAWTRSVDKQRVVLVANQVEDKFVEFPLSMKTQSMLIPKFNGIHGCIDSRIVNGKSQSYYQMTDRYRIEIPLWMFLPKKDSNGKTIPDTGFQVMMRSSKSVAKQVDLFPNDDSQYSVVEDIAYKSQVAKDFDYRPGVDSFATDSSLEANNESLRQWNEEHSEYVGFGLA